MNLIRKHIYIKLKLSKRIDIKNAKDDYFIIFLILC